MTAIHELRNTIDVETPLGYGKAIAWTDYGSQTNTVWKVVLYESGKVRNFYDDDIRVYPNAMDGGEIEKDFPTNQQLIRGLKNHFGPKKQEPVSDWMDEQYRDEYHRTVASGMFFEWYPELTGQWQKDKYAFCMAKERNEKNDKETK